MNARRRWRSERVPTDALRVKCLDAGLSSEDTAEIVEMVTKVQNGRRLVPKWGYQTFKFAYPYD